MRTKEREMMFFRKLACACLLTLGMFCMTLSVNAVRYAQVVFVGDYRSGKSAICARLRGDEYRDGKWNSDSFNFFQKGLEESDVNLKFWDTPGITTHRADVVSFLKGADYVFIVQDMSAPYTLKTKEYTDGIYRDIKKSISPWGKIVLVGGKGDLKDELPTNYAENYAHLKGLSESHGIDFMISSAKGNSGKDVRSGKAYNPLSEMIESYIKNTYKSMDLPECDDKPGNKVIVLKEKEKEIVTKIVTVVQKEKECNIF